MKPSLKNKKEKKAETKEGEKKNKKKNHSEQQWAIAFWDDSNDYDGSLADVPHDVQADGLLAVQEEDESFVAAHVAVDAVQGLVDVADEMNHELQRFDAVFLRRVLVR